MGGRRAGDEADPAAEAAEALYAAPLAAFIAERKRLATELTAAGEAEAARRLAKLAKPSVSAWVVNQLYRHARDDLDALLAAGQRMRAGDVAAGRDQRAALARLHQRAGDMLRDGGHAASPAMLRRIATTLQALSAIGSFDPDPPGQLAQDRDPPGFDVLAGVALAPAPASEKASAKPGKKDGTSRVERASAAAAREEPREEPDRVTRMQQQRVAAQRKLLEHTAGQAAKRAEARAREVVELRADLERAEATAERLRDALRKAEAELDEARAAADRAIRALGDK